MTSIANRAARHGPDFATRVSDQGGAVVAAGLLNFLARSDSDEPLRPVVRLSRPALKADIAHFLNLAFGRFPGIVDRASATITDPRLRDWLDQAVTGFGLERAFLNRLTVAAGPIHRQVGQERVTATLESLGRSMDMLATSERAGCAAGASFAFVLDWQSTRTLLEHVGLSLLIEVPHMPLPDAASTLALVEMLSAEPTIQRAMAFGSEQMLAQQRGLWRIIEARHQAMLSVN